MTKQEQYANWIMCLLGGDDYFVQEMLGILIKDGMIDQNHEIIYGQDTEDE